MIPTHQPTPDPTISVEQARHRLHLMKSFTAYPPDFEKALDALIAAVRAEQQSALVQAEQAQDEARQERDQAIGIGRGLEDVIEGRVEPRKVMVYPPVIGSLKHATIGKVHDDSGIPEAVADAQRDLLARVRKELRMTVETVTLIGQLADACANDMSTAGNRVNMRSLTKVLKRDEERLAAILLPDSPPSDPLVPPEDPSTVEARTIGDRLRAAAKSIRDRSKPPSDPPAPKEE